MPARNISNNVADTTPSVLRPYTFHGLDLSLKGGHAVADCPFCHRDGKFSVDISGGLWRCLVCAAGTESGGGNALVFLRLLHEKASLLTESRFHAEVARDRRLCSPNTVSAHGVCKSHIAGGAWLVPGYNPEGRLDQLYKRTWLDDGWRLLPTPGVWPEGKVHALHMCAEKYDVSREELIFCEGPWDGMALWECRHRLWAEANILAVPGCNIWRDEWVRMCAGKNVTLLYDSDHPKLLCTLCGKSYSSVTYTHCPVHKDEELVPPEVAPAGLDGMRRISRRLSGVAKSVRYLAWGENGYDESKPSGWDIRDTLSGVPDKPADINKRLGLLAGLTEKIKNVPSEWSCGVSQGGKPHKKRIEAEDCSTWQTCESSWHDAMHWRSDMSDALAVLFAVCASTQQSGNQLFLQLVGSAGSGKTTMCEGLLVSHHCHHLEHLTGFHSGWKGEVMDNGDGNEGSKNAKDCSLIARINGKTLVTPEADVMVSSPRYQEIMSQQRRIFDGKSGATFKNSSEDTVYEGLRTPWIMAGTHALMDEDQSRLGDRFLRYIISEPDENEKRAIMRSALRSERMAMVDTANGTAGSIVDGKTRKAYSLTGGYVNYLRSNIEHLLAPVERQITDQVEDRCLDLADLSADLRSRPNEDIRKKEKHDTKELPTRLARQYMRMAAHLAVVLNKPTVDDDVLRIVRKMALNTSHGHSLNIVQWMCAPNHKARGKAHQECGGIATETLASWSGMKVERMVNYLTFLRKIDVVTMKRSKHTGDLWALTDRVYNLYLRVMCS